MLFCPGDPGSAPDDDQRTTHGGTLCPPWMHGLCEIHRFQAIDIASEYLNPALERLQPAKQIVASSQLMRSLRGIANLFPTASYAIGPPQMRCNTFPNAMSYSKGRESACSRRRCHI